MEIKISDMCQLDNTSSTLFKFCGVNKFGFPLSNYVKIGDTLYTFDKPTVVAYTTLFHKITSIC